MGRPSSSTATIVKYALLVWRTGPLPAAPPRRRTPTSIDVRQAAFTDALNVTRSPSSTRSRKIIRSTPPVTTRQRECRIAASAAASSHSFITVPPCTNPAWLASGITIQRTSTDREAAAGGGPMRGP